MIETLQKRIRKYRALAEELRAKAETMPSGLERNAALQEADTWERMADWEEKNPPRPN